MTSRQSRTSGAPRAVTGRLLVDRGVWETIISCATSVNAKYEVGGILLGLRRGDHLHITYATTPGPKDRSSRLQFSRSDRSHRFAAVRRWVMSGFKVDWIGEWHTHPQHTPIPSLTDIQTWQEQIKRRQAPMVYIILGLQGSWIGWMDHDSSWPLLLVQAEETERSFLFEAGGSFQSTRLSIGPHRQR